MTCAWNAEALVAPVITTLVALVIITAEVVVGSLVRIATRHVTRQTSTAAGIVVATTLVRRVLSGIVVATTLVRRVLFGIGSLALTVARRAIRQTSTAAGIVVTTTLVRRVLCAHRHALSMSDIMSLALLLDMSLALSTGILPLVFLPVTMW